MSMANIQNDDLDYSQELELNVQCDEEDQHIAVLHCQKCETNLCKSCSDRIHSLKSLSGHQIVRLTEKPESPIKLKSLAFLFIDCSGKVVPPPSETHPESVEEGVGQYYCNEEGRTTIWLKQVPDDDKIDLSLYKYACVMVFLPRDKEEDIMRLRKMIQKTFWTRIVVSIKSPWNTDDFVTEVRNIAETDKRIEIVEYKSTHQLLDLVFEG